MPATPSPSPLSTTPVTLTAARNRRLAALRLAMLTATMVMSQAGCGGGSSSPSPAPVPTPSPSPSPASPSPATFAAQAQALYSVQPDVATCQAGQLTAATKQDALNTVNTIRQLHGLAPVVYDSTGDDPVQQISLMSAANNALNHAPPATWRCYTAAGATGGGSSNLYGGVASANLSFATTQDHMVVWLGDVGSEDTLGHRRWMLDPFLTRIAYGRLTTQAADGTRYSAAALQVINSVDGSKAVSVDQVAYPVGDYPRAYYPSGAALSLTVVADKSSRYGTANKSVDYSAATYSVVQRGGAALGVTGVVYDNTGYGVPNNVRFKVSSPLVSNVFYDVTVSGVKVNGVARSFTYAFRLVE